MVKDICKKACDAKDAMMSLSGSDKSRILLEVGNAISERRDEILSANDLDMKKADEKGMADGLKDRLRLTPERIDDICASIEKVSGMDDPIGSIRDMKTRPNGLIVGKMRVPMGVIGVIYEARPNVTPDVFSLCFKSGNVSILKGGSDAINSNKAFVDIIRETLDRCGVEKDVVQLIEDTSRDAAKELMHMDEYVDLLIPRGGAGLISTVVKESTIPVIETGTGNCHVYVDKYADIDMAVAILYNAKTSRIGVCNSCESLVVHRDIAAEFLPAAEAHLLEKNVEMRADEESIKYLKSAVPATEEDFGTEYLDYIISVKTVGDVDEAIEHINRYSTGHSECIVTDNYFNAQKFLKKVDSAAVYVNASTRFTDGGEFGLGAEIGISTQRLHARGPMGLEALTTEKYIIYGNGQVRN